MPLNCYVAQTQKWALDYELLMVGMEQPSEIQTQLQVTVMHWGLPGVKLLQNGA